MGEGEPAQPHRSGPPEGRWVRLPGGARVRGRSLRSEPLEDLAPVTFSLLLAAGDAPPWPHRRVRWPEFWVPRDTPDTLDALADVLDRARRGERVEVACRGGIGRTGTALAALAVLDGLPYAQAVGWVRSSYHLDAVETPWQRRWLREVPQG